MPICARIGCPVRLGLTDEHRFCFGHRDCSLADPCEVCESWTLRTSRLLLADYNAARGSTPMRVFHQPTGSYTPVPPPSQQNRGPLRAPTPAPLSQEDWGSLSSASSFSSEQPRHTHRSVAPLSRSDRSVLSRADRRDYLPTKEVTTAAPQSQPSSSSRRPAPAQHGHHSSHSRRRRRPSCLTHRSVAPLSRSDRSVSSGTDHHDLPAKEVTTAAPQSQPSPSFRRPSPTPPAHLPPRSRRRRRPSCCAPQPEVTESQQPPRRRSPPARPARVPPVRPLPSFLPPDVHDDYFEEGSDLPWAKPIYFTIPQPMEDSWMEKGEGDHDVLVVNTDERLDPAAPPLLHRLNSKAEDTPFPDVPWTEVEARAVHLISTILPDEIVPEPEDSRRHYPSSSRSSNKRLSFHLAPAVVDEMDAIVTHLEAPSSSNPGISIGKPYPLHLQKWVPQESFSASYPAMDPDMDLLVKDPPRSLTTPIETHGKRSELFRAIILTLTESALALEAGFLATDGLLTSESRPFRRIAENVRTVMALAKKRNDVALKIATRGIGIDILAHRDAILAESRTSSVRRRPIRAARIGGPFLFNQELALLRNVLSPSSAAPTAAAAAAATPSTPTTARSAARGRSWGSSFRDQDPPRSRRQRGRPSNAGNRRGRAAPSPASKPNSHSRPHRK